MSIKDAIFKVHEFVAQSKRSKSINRVFQKSINYVKTINDNLKDAIQETLYRIVDYKSN